MNLGDGYVERFARFEQFHIGLLFASLRLVPRRVARRRRRRSAHLLLGVVELVVVGRYDVVERRRRRRQARVPLQDATVEHLPRQGYVTLRYVTLRYVNSNLNEITCNFW